MDGRGTRRRKPESIFPRVAQRRLVAGVYCRTPETATGIRMVYRIIWLHIPQKCLCSKHIYWFSYTLTSELSELRRYSGMKRKCRGANPPACTPQLGGLLGLNYYYSYLVHSLPFFHCNRKTKQLHISSL